MYYFVQSDRFQKIMLLASFAGMLCLSGCCVYNYKNKTDPLEPVNRSVMRFNKVVDGLYLKPVATAYDKFLPKPFRYASNSFFQNLREVPTIVNDLLQLKFKQARTATARFCINTTLGVGGLIDVASLGKIEKHLNDFGLTMAHYGYKQSVYLVLPLIGPSTFRDGVGMYVDTYTGVWPYIRPARVGWILYAINVIDARAKMLYAEPIIEEASVDEYIFIRNAYLQHRRHLMNLDKEPVLCDLVAADLPDDNEAVSLDDQQSVSSDVQPSDMPDDNETLNPNDINKDHEGKDIANEKTIEDDKPKVGAAAVAALQVDDIYHPSQNVHAAAGSRTDISIGAALQSRFILTTNTLLYIAPGVVPFMTVTMSNMNFAVQLPVTFKPDNPEEMKGTSTMTITQYTQRNNA